jgi:hypothetical protein
MINLKMKKILIPFILILTSWLISAQLSFSEFLYNTDSSLIILSSIFLVSFLIFNFSLSKLFKEQKNITMVISAVLAFLLIYGINSIGWDIEDFFFDIGISEDMLLTLIPLILLFVLLFLFVRMKNKKVLLYIIGAFLVALGVFIFRDAAQVLVLGIIIIIFTLIFFPLLKFLKTSFGIGKTKPSKKNINSTTTTS